MLWLYLICVPFKPDVISELKLQGVWEHITHQLLHAYQRGVDRPNPHPYSYKGGIDTIRALAILIGFQDLAPVYQPTAFDTLIFSHNVYPTGSVHDYYWEASCGRFWLIGDVVGWFTAEHGYQYYGNGCGGFGWYPQNAQRLAEEAVDAADSMVDYSLYDNDGDGYVDALFIVHAGRGREDTGNDDYIHSHVWCLSSTRYYDGVRIFIYSMEPELRANGRLVEIGVYCHEFGHLLGLPDLYDYDGSSAGLGMWSIMAGGCWANGGDTPVHFDAWCKKELGWVTPTILDSNTINVEVMPAELYPTAIKLWHDNNFGAEYFLVEFRKRIGFDSYLPGTGVLIYHVDENVWGNNNEWHPLVAVEQADGRYDLQYGRNWGDGGDPFPGTTHKHEFDDITDPNSNSYNNEVTLVGLYNIELHDSVATADIYFTAEGRPRPPRQLATVPGLRSVEVSWRTNPEPDIVAYRVYVDSTPICETADTFYFIDGLTDTLYVVGVTAVDDEGYESYMAECVVTPITLSRDMLVVDETRNGTGDIPASPTDTQVDSFYTAVLEGYTYDVWDVDSQGVPGIDVLGKYKLIFWYADDYAQPYIRNVVDDIQTYLNAGGKLILSSWQGIRNMLGGTYPYGFEPSDWLYEWWGIDSVGLVNTADFVGTYGEAGYPDLRVDTSKIISNWDGALKYVELLYPVDAEVIARFKSRSGDYDSIPVAIKHDMLGGSCVVYFGFPLYFMELNDVRELMTMVLEQLDVIEPVTQRLPAIPSIVYQAYELPHGVNVRLYDVMGRYLGTYHELRGLTPGVYFMQLVGTNTVRKLTFIK